MFTEQSPPRCFLPLQKPTAPLLLQEQRAQHQRGADRCSRKLPPLPKPPFLGNHEHLRGTGESHRPVVFQELTFKWWFGGTATARGICCTVLAVSCGQEHFISQTPQVALTPFYDPDPRMKGSELPEPYLCSASARGSPHPPPNHHSSKCKF